MWSRAGLAFGLVVMLVPGLVRAADEKAPQSALRPMRLSPLPLGQIKPAGWLKGQLELQASGLSGHLDAFWPDIKESAWIGGKAEGWERVPYWLDGMVPLAYLLDDAALKAKVKRYVDYILEHQRDDGWLGPLGDNDKNHKAYDPWPLFPLFKALTQYQEASGDPRVVPALVKCARRIDAVISKEPLSSWGRYRAADFALSLYWLYDRTQDAALLDTARKAMAQAHDWSDQWGGPDLAPRYRVRGVDRFGLDTHGVNNGMALKFGAIRSRLSGADVDQLHYLTMLSRLDEYHGQIHGLFTCDEHLAGLSPSQGTELCTVVEAMYSLEQTIAALGPEALPLADRLERIAFNALPATFKKDMTAHQYDQQVNQVVCQRAGEHVYASNGPDSNLFGLEPNFGCCTANMHQGWPKLTSNLWMKSSDGGLTPIVYAPCVVTTKVGDRPVTIAVETDYPFRHQVRVVVTAPEEVDFPLDLRVPTWSREAAVTLGDGADAVRISPRGAVPDGCDPCGTFRIQRRWKGTTPLTLELDDQPRLWTRPGAPRQGGVGVTYGPLVFALPIKTEWSKLKDRDGPFDDWEVQPKSPWNYALEVPAAYYNGMPIGTLEKRPMSAQPFSVTAAPLTVTVRGRQVPTWGLVRGAAAPPPSGFVPETEPLQDLALIPYGCTDLRIAEFPVTKQGKP